MEIKISPNFTIEDIHKIREYNYTQTKNISIEKQLENINKNGTKYFDEILKKYR